ncbi:MAG: outer membrane lipoprotein-sorting protein [Sphaerochaetaceae bacterium]|nr:outer membrane lipoprotein-sorting protein [Sphaerochaetaceae bacterium]
MKKLRLLTVSILVALSALAGLYAQELTGEEIIRLAHEIPEPDSSSVKAKLLIHSKKGTEKTREVIMKSKNYGDVTKEVIVFTSPKDVSGVGYLMFNYEEQEDGSKKDSENWLYMPALKKVKRIASSGTEAEGNFMGTDFTYEDMGDRSISKDTYTLLGEEYAGGVKCWKIKCVSIEHTESDPERVVYIGQDDYLLYRCEFYDRHGALHRVLECSEIEYIDSYPCTKVMKMQNVQSGSWSMITMSDVQYNTGAIDDSVFTVSALEQGRIR